MLLLIFSVNGTESVMGDGGRDGGERKKGKGRRSAAYLWKAKTGLVKTDS
jgi:hypothetical protein